MSRGQGQTGAVVLFLALALLSGCATSKPEMAWVRTDGRKILDDPALLKKGETDIALCNANLDSGAVDEGARKCMGLKGYALVPKDQAEDARAGFAATQRVLDPRRRPVASSRLVCGTGFNCKMHLPFGCEQRGMELRHGSGAPLTPWPVLASPVRCLVRGWKAGGGYE